MQLGRWSACLVAVVLGLVAAPGLVAAQSAPASPSPSSPAASPSPSPTLTLPPTKAPLAAGRYTSDLLGAPLTLDLADSGWKGDEASGQFLELSRQMGDSSGVLSVMTFDGVVANDPCAPAFDGQVEVSAAAFAEWLSGLSALSTTTTPTTLFGQPATQLDTTVVATACPDSPFILLWDGFRLYPSEAMRVITQDQGDKVIIVSAETVQSTDLPDFLDVARPVIDSMTLGANDTDSPQSSPPLSA